MEHRHCAFVVVLLTAARATNAAPEADLVTSLPGFGKLTGLPFRIYSGYLKVPGPFLLNEYDSLEIHYQFQTSQSDTPDADPLVTWHQGGPGGSSIIVGLYTEMGALQIDDNGPYYNQYAWNKVANMLYLESPAGSGQLSGYSACIKDGQDVPCAWDDVSQAEAYSHTLLSFKAAFPEYSSNDLYLTGESYFGQYGPNIANYIVSNEESFSSLNLKGMALGNACWGGSKDSVVCNGPNSEQNDVDLYFGKGLISKKLYDEVYEACDFPHDPTSLSDACGEKLDAVSKSAGPHNPYDIYDDCPATSDFLQRNGKSMRWLKQQLISHMPMGFGRDQVLSHDSGTMSEKKVERELLDKKHHKKSGGYLWSCGGISATESWIVEDAVKIALHLKKPGRSEFSYARSGPASVLLYPALVKKLRILIYNGDSDIVVPYKGNEEWIGNLEATGAIAEKEAWRPWFEDDSARVPAGYVTSFSVKGAEQDDIEFHFLTIRLAGHMVPTFQPGPSLSFFKRFLASEPY